MSYYASKNNGLSVTAYIGDGAVLLAFDIDQDKIANFAGFSIKCTTPAKGPYPSNSYFLQNILSFNPITSTQQIPSIQAMGSDKAPFQTFHWVHFPSAGPGNYQYDVYASYFQADGTIQLGTMVTVNVDLSYQSFQDLEVGFTRGYVSSQAYADRFKNASIRPTPKSMNFDTTPYQPQYQWLGAHARKIVFDFLAECQNDGSIYLDVFSYDFDEPDIISVVSKLGSRVRVLQDNSTLHIGPTALEPQTVQVLTNAGATVKLGHFARFSHDKIFIQKKNGQAIKVLTGSANFSIRGLYVQANSVLVFDDPVVADLYEQAFEASFGLDFSNGPAAANQFAQSEIGSQWNSPAANSNLPKASFCFSPHGINSEPISLKVASDAIDAATSSVLFAVMEMAGGGNVMNSLKNLGTRQNILALGTIQNDKELQLFQPGQDISVASFDFLDNNVPAPFQEETRGGFGQVIHHKFVVCDFNGESPVVFCGSSNLSLGGEQENGDNLIAIYDQKIATLYAVEAIRLYDHFQFRSLHQQSTADNPLVLDSTDKWTGPYFDPRNIKFTERESLASPQNIAL